MGTGRLPNESMERLQKAMAKRGIASRRKAEEYISAGRVRVNGKVIVEQGVKVSDADRIELDGVVVGGVKKHVYIAFYKPTRVMTTAADPQGRQTVFDFLTKLNTRVFSVGRLDYETSGLLLLTNDGDFAYRLTHPGFGVEKTYEALVDGVITEQAVLALRKGVMLEGRKTSPARVKVLGSDASSSKLEIAIHEGRNRQVRNMLELVGFPCVKLTRVRIGRIDLRGLRPGEWRYLKDAEVAQLSVDKGRQNPIKR